MTLTDWTARPPRPADCKCELCVEACNSHPGWFMPGEAEKLARAKGVKLQELFDADLGVDWWEPEDELGNEEPIFVLAPRLGWKDGGTEYPGNPDGRCAWLINGLCAVHDLGKPYECAMAHHDNREQSGEGFHREVAAAWNKPRHQKLIRRLLGREPEVSVYEGGFCGLLGRLFG
jgi:hypothetical protein